MADRETAGGGEAADVAGSDSGRTALPPSSFSEKAFYLEKWGLAYTYNVCHCLPFLMLRKKCIEPLYEGWSEWRFLTELANRLGLSERFPWKSEEEFVSFMIAPSSLSFDYLLNEKPEGDYYAEKEYTCPDGFFRTPSKKIEIYSDALEQVGFDPLPSYLEPERGPIRFQRRC